jgi:RNA polymerase sigma-54 factor
MNIGLKQMPSQQLQQRLIMTPKLQQAIKVLLMSRMDLTQHLNQQLQQNPLLDEAVAEDLDIETSSGTDELDPDTEWNEPEESLDRADKEPDIDWESCFDDTISISERDTLEYWADGDAPQADIAQLQTLQEFLMVQVNVVPFSDIERRIGEQIIGNLDDNGQLNVSPRFSVGLDLQRDLDSDNLSEELRSEFESNEISLSRNVAISPKSKNSTDAAVWRITDEDNKQVYTVSADEDKLNIYSITLEEIAEDIGCEIDFVENILRFIQRNFDPTGIAYRTIPETLLVQMEAVQIDQPLIREIVKHHFDDLMNNLIPRIAKNLNVGIDAVLEAKELIGTLDPYPGRHFSDRSDPKRFNDRKRFAGSIVPDIIVEKGDGGYRFITNDDGMPRLRLNSLYVNMMRNGDSALDKNAKQWLENYKNQAVDLLKSIDQRRRTIKRVTEAIFEVQSDFFEQGVTSLKPLVLKQIADMAGVHESTVSRVTTNKYVETPQGIYKLKFFFSSELPTDCGDNIAVTSVKEKIREMIEKEDVAKPLSDQMVSNILKVQGIHAARRTVAKYREELGMLSSNKRKRKW